MDLKTYTADLPHGGVAELAKEVGITPVYLSQLSARQAGREPSPELCVKLETATGRAVMRWDTRPDDWHRIWPELVGDQKAPPIPEAEEAA